MNPTEAESFYAEVLGILRDVAPWAAEELDESVRSGRPVAKQIRRRGGVARELPVAPGRDLGANQFLATEALSATERLELALDAVERVMVDPPSIERHVRGSFDRWGVQGFRFEEDVDAPSRDEKLFGIREDHAAKIVTALREVRPEVRDAS